MDTLASGIRLGALCFAALSLAMAWCLYRLERRADARWRRLMWR